MSICYSLYILAQVDIHCIWRCFALEFKSIDIDGLVTRMNWFRLAFEYPAMWKKGNTDSNARDQVEGKFNVDVLTCVSILICGFDSCAFVSVLLLFVCICVYIYNMLIYIYIVGVLLVWLYLLVWDITKCNECPPWTDTFMGNQRDMLEDVQRHVRRVDNDLRAHVDQYSMEVNVREDLVTTCILVWWKVEDLFDTVNWLGSRGLPCSFKSEPIWWCLTWGKGCRTLRTRHLVLQLVVCLLHRGVAELFRSKCGSYCWRKWSSDGKWRGGSSNRQMMTWTMEMVMKIKPMGRSFQISWQICGGWSTRP